VRNEPPGVQSLRLHLLQRGFLRGCRGIPALVPGAPPPPSLTQVLTGLFLTLFFSHLLTCAGFSPLLNTFSTEAPPGSPWGSAVACGGAAGELATASTGSSPSTEPGCGYPICENAGEMCQNC